MNFIYVIAALLLSSSAFAQTSELKNEIKSVEKTIDPKTVKAVKREGDAKQRRENAKKAKAEGKTADEKPAAPVATPAPETDMTVKVVKSKNGRALIAYSKKVKLAKKKYHLTDFRSSQDEDDDVSRDYFLGASLDMGLFSQATTVASTETTTDLKAFVLNASFGKNFGILEIGPFIEYAFQTVGNIDSKTILAGLLIDYNFRRNDSEADGIFGVRLSAGYGQEDNSALTAAGKVLRIQPALYLKWFGLSDSVAMVLEAGFRIQNTEYDTTKVSTKGAIGKFGVLGYF